MTFAMLPVRNLQRRRMRSTLTSLGIAVALSGVIALVGLSRGVELNTIASMNERGIDLMAYEKGSVELLSTTLDQSLAGRIAGEDGVKEVIPYLGDFVDLDSGQLVLLSGFPQDSAFWRRLPKLEGHVPGLDGSRSVVLGSEIAAALGKKPGDALRLEGEDLLVAGVSKQASAMDDRSVMMPLDAMQALLGREGKVSGFQIRLQHPADAAEVAAVRARLSGALPKLSIAEGEDLARNNQLARLLRAISWSTSAVVLAMAFVAVLNTLLMSVTERTRDIGLYAAIGWSASRMMAMFMLEGLILSAAGAAIGVPLGLGALRALMAHPQIGAFIQPEVTVALVLESSLAAMLLGALGGAYPAWRAIRMNPVEMLRAE